MTPQDPLESGTDQARDPQEDLLSEEGPYPWSSFERRIKSRRRMRKLIPAALLLGAVGVLSWWFLPDSRQATPPINLVQIPETLPPVEPEDHSTTEVTPPAEISAEKIEITQVVEQARLTLLKPTLSPEELESAHRQLIGIAKTKPWPDSRGAVDLLTTRRLSNDEFLILDEFLKSAPDTELRNQRHRFWPQRLGMLDQSSRIRLARQLLSNIEEVPTHYHGDITGAIRIHKLATSVGDAISQPSSLRDPRLFEMRFEALRAQKKWPEVEGLLNEERFPVSASKMATYREIARREGGVGLTAEEALLNELQKR